MELTENTEMKFKVIRDYEGFFWLLSHDLDSAFDGHTWKKVDIDTFPKFNLVGDFTINEFVNLLEVTL